MKRYIKTTSVILFAALTLAGCSKTEEFQGNPDSALQIESVNGISPFALTTKAVITGNTLPDSDAATGIGIFVTAADGSAYDGHDKGYSNVKYANSGSGWSTSSPIYLSDTQGKLYGYFPYNSNANDLKAIPVQSSLDGTDYLYAEPQTVSHSNKSVSLTMNHALSRLQLTIRKGANFTANAPLSEIILTSKAIDATGTMDITTGAISVSKKSNETGIVELATDGTITSEGIVKDILLIPADGSEGKKDITIILTIDGKLASVSLSGDNGLDIRSGIQNNVTLTVEDTGIKVTGVGVGVWGEGFSQQVEVDSHAVTVKLADDISAGNVTISIHVEGFTVKIIACPIISRGLICEISGNANCDRVRDYRDVHTFTISDIHSDITAIIKPAPLPPGALPGVFTVNNKDVKKVYFSKGNLWADDDKALHFEANQYGFNSSYEASHVSYFTWSDNITSAVSNYNSGSNLFCDESHKVSVDGGDAIYYALSKDEWTYLFNNHISIWGTANSVNGRFIAPDGFVGDVNALASVVNDWETAQAAGIVFLPAAGNRNGSNVYDVGDYGRYWSSTAYGEYYAYHVSFGSYDVYPDNGDGRNVGCSVRLITESK